MNYSHIGLAGIYHLVFFGLLMLLPMAMHFLSDVTAGFVYGYFGNKLGYPPEGVPPESPGEFAVPGAE